MDLSTTGIVAIGRNEGERLVRCLDSAVRTLGSADRVVYVDSNSDDDSVAMAEGKGITVHPLDVSKPFSAARARDEGYQVLREKYPELAFVFFIDGDCEIVPGFVQAALGVMHQHPDRAAVCGRRRERFPEASIYNTLADIEWDTPIGLAQACGGDALHRVAAYENVEGFDHSVPAGEEPELCHRYRAASWTIERIDAEMTLHDSAMTHRHQFWKRHIRSGYSGLDVEKRFKIGLFKRDIRSALFWIVGLPGFALVVALLGLFTVGPAGLILGGVVLMGIPLQVARMSRRMLNELPRKQAHQYGWLMMYAKLAQVAGMWRYITEGGAKQKQLIEYKKV